MALASSGHTVSACLLCLSLGTSEQGNIGVEEKVNFWSQRPFLPEAPAFLGWVGKTPKHPAEVGYTRKRLLQGGQQEFSLGSATNSGIAPL